MKRARQDIISLFPEEEKQCLVKAGNMSDVAEEQTGELVRMPET